MRSLNLDQLKTFVTVVELGSFSAAARQLNMTQPAVSLQVRALEDRFGIELIERVGKRASATAAGLALMESAASIFAETERVASTMRRFREGRVASITIGSTLTTLIHYLPPIIKKLRDKHPEIELVITNMVTRDTVDAVINNQVDFGLVTLPIKNPHLRITSLRTDNLVAIFPASTAAPARITPDYVSEQAVVLEHPRGAVFALVSQWMAKGAASLRAPMHVGTVDAAKILVVSGVGMSIVPEVSARDDSISVRPLAPPIPTSIGLVELRKGPKSAVRDIVRNALLEIKTAR